MKPLIVGTALTILFAFFLIFQQDNDLYIRQLENLKYVADEAAASGALYYEDEAYSEGFMVYRKDESLKAIDSMIKSLLNLDDYLNPIGNNYWRDKIDYYVYVFDETGVKTTFKNNMFLSSETFEIGYLFKDNIANYEKVIFEPTIIVTINAGKPFFRFSFLNTNDVIRSSGYEYVNR